ncbi:MAG: hypothetical protein R8M14_03500 [Ghiorsea sp.]
MIRLLFVLVFMFPMLSYGSEARSVNLAVFQLLDDNSEYDGVIEGDLMTFLSSMKDKKMLAIIHTEGAFSGDIVTLQTSVLHDNAGGLGDYGLDCELSFKKEHESDEVFYSLGGVCRINRVGYGQSEKIDLIIPPTPIPDTTSEFEEWYLFDEDETSGVGFFVNIGKQ